MTEKVLDSAHISDVLRSIMKKFRPVSTSGKSVIINLESNAREAGNMLSTIDNYYSEKMSIQADKEVERFELEKVKEMREAEMFELEKEKLKAQILKL